MNVALKRVTSYAWISAGVLFASYLYFVGAITFSVITEQSLQSGNKALISSTSRQELAYLNMEKTLTQSYASSTGLVAATALAYTAPRQAFAWNVGH